jgi:glycosyltransferase involved in cell wall biosynthesis
MPQAVTLVIPCFNEAERLDAEAFRRLAAARPSLRLLFVDDGSTDATRDVLAALRVGVEGKVDLLALLSNAGKAEAVRRGLLAAMEGGARIVGYADADLATPWDELIRLVDDMLASPTAVVMGARVRLLGTLIDRRPARHYLGRIFATVASLGLGIPVYDTQCGAKLFQVSDGLRAALSHPFRSRWGFDVELLERLLAGGDGAAALRATEMREVPLRAWRDVRGSKMGLAAMSRAGALLLGLCARAIVRRAAGRRRGER